MSEIDQHARRIAELVAELEASPDEAVKARFFELMEHVDHLHRTCVWRLFERITELGGKGLVERIAADPAVKTLFILYDLIPALPLAPLEADAPVTPPHSGSFVPLASLTRRPAWRVAFAAADLPPGSLQAVEVDGVPVLLCRLDGGVSAFRNACPGSVLPLHLLPLAEGEIRCPWHGCRFDARTGARRAGEGPGLETFAAELAEDKIVVAQQPSPGAQPP